MSLFPAKKCPRAFDGRSLSQTIFRMASIGTGQGHVVAWMTPVLALVANCRL